MIRNKKFALLSIFFIASTFAVAELHKPNRYVDIGVEVEAGVSNNYFSSSDVLVKDVLIDLQKIASEMPKDGWSVEYLVKEKNSIDLNFGERFRLGFFAGVTGNGNINIGNGLFDFLGKGYEAGTSSSFKIKGYADLYADAGFSFRTRIMGFGIKISPSYYVPVLYMPSTTATATWLTDADTGKIEAYATADVKVYSAINLKEYLENGDDENDEADPGAPIVEDLSVSEEIQRALQNGGFDISFEVEHAVLGRLLEIGVFGRIPILPGKLTYEMSRTVTASAVTAEQGVLDFLNDNKPEFEHDFGSTTYSECNEKYYRPLRVGAEAIVRPFLGNIFVVEPMFAVVARNPYSKDVIIYPEYSLDMKVSLFNVLGLTFGTGYLDQVFVQRMNLMINARVLEVNAGVALRSSSFPKSFTFSGASAFVGVHFGF